MPGGTIEKIVQGTLKRKSSKLQMKIYREIIRLLDQGQPAVLATLVARDGSGAREPGSKMIIRQGGATVGSLGGGLVDARTIEAADRVLHSGDPLLLTVDPVPAGGDTCGSRVRVFLEPLVAGPRVMIIGAGHVGRAVARAARRAGFLVQLADDRAPEETGTDHLRCRPDDIFQQLTPCRTTPIIICMRSHALDYEVLVQALATPAAFIGLLGSRRKRESFFSRLRESGMEGRELERIVTPVGLDIGARTPEEIAVSIVAQLIKVYRESPPGPVGSGLPSSSPL